MMGTFLFNIRLRAWCFNTASALGLVLVRLLIALALVVCHSVASAQMGQSSALGTPAGILPPDKGSADQRPLVLLVQPDSWLSQGTRIESLQPLLQQLSTALDHAVIARRSTDALAHWRVVQRSDDFDLAFDEAHFTSFRSVRHGFTVLVQEQTEARFGIVVRARTLITAPSDLSAEKIASPAPPGLAALRLMKLFPDVLSAPMLVPMAGRPQALSALISGRIGAVV